jgi:hypothetical protein
MSDGPSLRERLERLRDELLRQLEQAQTIDPAYVSRLAETLIVLRETPAIPDIESVGESSMPE